MARPLTTLLKLPDNWKEVIMEASQDGASDVELRCLLGIGKQAWYTLLETNGEFSETISVCHDLCQVWWEKTGRKMATGADGNATVWVFNMKNRFGWHDKQSFDHSSADGSMSPKPTRIELVAPLLNNESDDDDDQS